jgi:hypothetical protein
MWADGIVVASPALDQDLSLLQRREDFPVQQLVALRNPRRKRLNGEQILSHIFTVTNEQAPSGIRAISIDDDVRRSTKAMDRC